MVDSAEEALARRLGHDFVDPSLLTLAVTHRSWCAENDESEPNERLEFLGDSVLGLAVANRIYSDLGELSEGGLAKIRAHVVSAPTLAAVAAEVDLGSVLRLGKGEEQSGGRSKTSILSDALEAVIGAVYLDGGWETARALVERLFEASIAEAAAGPGGRDYKTRLQELAARSGHGPPRYELTSDGPDHEKRFFATVVLDGDRFGDGHGSSKKQAEQAAARLAWEDLSSRPIPPDPSPDDRSSGDPPTDPPATNESPEHEHA